MATSSSTTSPGINEAAEGQMQPPAVIASSSDSDEDGLTDEEEKALGTDKAKADSDSDNFSDAAELQRGYNPSGAGKLSQSKNIGNFENSNFGMLYPAAWKFTSSGNDSLILHAEDEQMIKVSLQPNLKNESIANWYREQFSGQEILDSQYYSQVDIAGNDLWQGVFSPDGLTLYLTNSRKQTIASINYDLGFTGKLNYQKLFLAIISSFVLKN
jgi:hypothetical protein